MLVTNFKLYFLLQLVLLNNQIHDLDISKLTSLVCVQQTFPNDNLNLFEIIQKPINDVSIEHIHFLPIQNI